jgi:hypothetical protein
MRQIWTQRICKERPLDSALKTGSRATAVNTEEETLGFALGSAAMINFFGSQYTG